MGAYHVLRWYETIDNSRFARNALQLAEEQNKVFEPKHGNAESEEKEPVAVAAIVADDGSGGGESGKNDKKKDKKNEKKEKKKAKKESAGGGGGNKPKGGANANANKSQSGSGGGIAKQGGASFDIGIDRKKWDGKVVTRFPPEPSGFLHIGHAKAVLLNHEIARDFNGKMLLRMDDTNPVKEKGEYVENIMRDLESLGVDTTNTKVTHTSDYFNYYIQVCTDLIKQGTFYVDPTPAEEVFF